METRRFKIKLKENWGRNYATEIGELQGDILEITEDTWSVIQDKDSHLRRRWEELNRVAKIKEV